MTAKELRIGNWVYDEGDLENPIQIVNIQEDNTSWLKPIPLTEEWLVKLGFVSNPYQDIYAKVSDTISFVIDVDKTRGYLELYSKGVDLKHVHQLQNLYFALTGEEL